MAEPPNAAQARPEPVHEGRMAFLFDIGFPELQRQRHGKVNGPELLALGDLPACAVGEGFGHGKAHAVPHARVACGVRPDAGAQGRDLVRGLQRGDVAQDDAELGAAFLVLFGRRGFQRTDHAPQYLLEVQDAPLVDGDLEIVDRREVPEMPLLPFLEVEQFQMGDHALAVPEQFEHVLGGKFRKLERDAVAAAQARKPVKQHMGRHPEQFRRVRRVVRHVGGRELRIAFGLEPRFHDHFDRQHVHAPDKLRDLALAFAGGGECLLPQCLDPLGKVLEERLVHVFGKVEE